jgi:hypothetical protein
MLRSGFFTGDCPGLPAEFVLCSGCITHNRMSRRPRLQPTVVSTVPRSCPMSIFARRLLPKELFPDSTLLRTIQSAFYPGA